MPRISLDRLYIVHKRRIIMTAISMITRFLFSGELHTRQLTIGDTDEREDRP